MGSGQRPNSLFPAANGRGNNSQDAGVRVYCCLDLYCMDSKRLNG